jgi:hypothetical protein
VKVLGSRYALVIKRLRKQEFELPLERTRVAIGNSAGLSGSKYISGRVDKACLEIIGGGVELGAAEGGQTINIGLVAEIVRPYAVYVRNRT